MWGEYFNLSVVLHECWLASAIAYQKRISCLHSISKISPGLCEDLLDGSLHEKVSVYSCIHACNWHSPWYHSQLAHPVGALAWCIRKVSTAVIEVLFSSFEKQRKKHYRIDHLCCPAPGWNFIMRKALKTSVCKNESSWLNHTANRFAWVLSKLILRELANNVCKDLAMQK